MKIREVPFVTSFRSSLQMILFRSPANRLPGVLGSLLCVSVLLLSSQVLAQIDDGDAETEGLVTIPSRHSVPITIDRLAARLENRGMKIFARIDFAADAHAAGLEMHEAQLLIFGNPKAGTPIIVEKPSAAVDLPLKALAWEDGDGKVWVSYNSPEYIGRRHRIPRDLLQSISGIGALISGAAE